MSELPPVLLDPPWRRPRPASSPPASQVAPPPSQIAKTAPPAPPSSAALAIMIDAPGEAPRLAWAEGERDRFKGSPQRALSEQAEERLYERLLDELDKERVIPATDLAKLGDEHLLDLAGELRASHVDVKGLELLLARLGDDYVAEAVAIVRVAPPDRGLFEAMAPVRAAQLARVAASLFSQREMPDRDALSRPFVAKPADVWLERFADVAAPPLAAQDDRAARAALAWIAARGRTGAIPESHAAFARPYASLAAIDRPWLAFLAARGQEAQVLALVATPRPDEESARRERELEAAALLAARALAGNARSAAKEWLVTHRAVALRVLEAAATEDARVALAVLGGDATAGDPGLDDVPTAIPSLPAFFDPKTLPAPRLLDGTPLPPDAVKALGEMLRFSSFARPYPGIAQVRAACDPVSLDELALAILECWREAGEPPTDLWALESAAKIGGDGAAREVAARARAWSKGAEPPRHAWDDDERRVVLVNDGDRGWAYARTGCQVLATNGSDLALTLLDDISRSGGTAWLRKEARRALDGASETRSKEAGRKLRPAELADDIVPDLGLDADGSTVLDLGPRSFKVSFDEALAPLLVDGEGGTAKTFPRARKDDDAEKSGAAKRRFQGLAKDAKVLARQQILQLEGAMCARRAWTSPAFRERFVAHPLLRHLGRRLVWGLEDLSRTFRVAEDLTFADEHDQALTFGDEARIVLVHPVLLSAESRASWSDRFGDYRIVQPFSQLGREIFTAGDEDVGKNQLARAEGMKTSRGRLFQLSRRGWTAQVENGWIEEYFRVLPSGAHARIGISPGMAIGPAPEEDVEYALTSVSSTYALDRLPPIDFSELARDVAYLGAG